MIILFFALNIRETFAYLTGRPFKKTARNGRGKQAGKLKNKERDKDKDKEKVRKKNKEKDWEKVREKVREKEPDQGTVCGQVEEQITQPQFLDRENAETEILMDRREERGRFMTERKIMLIHTEEIIPAR